MILAPGLLALALLVQPKQVYQWRDAKGQPHITNTPPPPGAERMEPPPPPAVERGRPGLAGRARSNRVDRRKAALSSTQQAAWQALEQRMAGARAQNDRRTLDAVTDSLIDESLWGGGLWAIPLLPALSVTLMGLLGWWLALGLRPGTQVPIVGGFLLLGLAFGQILLASFLYHPQALRLRENMELLELHNGSRRELRSENQALLQRRYQAVEDAADPLQPPWRFPAQVSALRRDMKRVMVDP